MSKEITAFKCDHCDRIFKSKSAVTRHEKFCSRNPANHFKCFDCAFLEYKREPIYDEDNNFVAFVKKFNCTKLNIGLHAHKAVQRNLTEVLKTTELMRLNCDSFKDGIHYTRDFYE